MLTVNELFSGIGSQVAALRRLDIPYKVVGISEIDRFAIQSYEAINGPTRNYGDISKIPALDYADLWTYSFPCQDLSVAGKQAGIKETTRSGLLLQVERLLKNSVVLGNQPKYLLLENVKALVSKKFKPDFDKWLNTLEELGYNNYWKVLNAKDYGVPQNRERVFVVSIRKDVDTHGYTFPEPFKLNRRLKDVLETNVDEKYYLKQELVETFIKRLAKREASNTIRCGGAGSIDQKHNWDLVAEPSIVQNPHGYNNGGIIKDSVAQTMTSNGSYHLNNFVCLEPINACADGTAPALTAHLHKETVNDCTKLDRHSPALGVKEVGSEIRIRKLTPKECWRLMGFTDLEFDLTQMSGVSNSQLYKQAGNSIVVDVLAAIFKELFK